MPTDLHIDVLRNDWHNMRQEFVKRTHPGDESLGAQVLSGWATYVNVSEPHSMDDCPFKDSHPEA